MGRTINGREPSEVTALLTEEIPENLLDHNPSGYAFFPKDVYQNRLDDVIGVLNYSFEITEPQLVTIGSRQHIALKGSLIIRDDDGNVFCVKDATGCVPVIIVKETQEAAAAKNDFESAASDAFKRCCKLLGIGRRQLKEERKKGKKSSSERSTASNQPSTLMRVQIKSSWKALGTKGHSCNVVVLQGGTPADYELVVWESGRAKIEEIIPMEKFMKLYVPGKEFSLMGHLSVFNGRNGTSRTQIVLDEPVCNQNQ